MRKSKAWDEQEWDEEEMVTNARVLEDIEDLRLKIQKDPGFRESSSWPTLTEWCSMCLEMRFVKFVLPDNQEDNIVKDLEEIVVMENENEEVKGKTEKKTREKPAEEDEGKRPDARAKVGNSEPGAHRRKRKGGRGSRMRRLLVHQLLLTEKRGLPLSRLLCLRRTEDKSQVQGRREQEESASPILRKRRSELAGGYRKVVMKEGGEGMRDTREDGEEAREEVRGGSTGALSGDFIRSTPRSTQTEVTTSLTQVYPQTPGAPPFPNLTPSNTPAYTPAYTPAHTLPNTLPFTPHFTPHFTPQYTSQPAYHTPPFTPPPCGPMPGLQWLFCGGCQMWGIVTPTT